MENLIGLVVKSRAGRDNGRLYVVISTEGEFIYVADGDVRKTDNPKKKKLKHIQKTNHFAEQIKNRLEAGEVVENFEVRKALAEYLN